MKYLFIIVTLFSLVSFGSESCTTNTSEEVVADALVIKTDVPKFLEGAVIIVRTKDGKETQVPAERFKVVPRKQQFIVTKTTQNKETLCKADKKHNRVSALAGNGIRSGLTKTQNANDVTVENKIGATGGAQYQYVFDNDISLGVQAQDNKTTLISIGLDF